MIEQKRKWRLGGGIFILILAVVIVAIVLNREWLYDYYRGAIYQPSAEMARIRSDLQLTDKGMFLFNASQPELDGSTEFNSYCRDDVTEVAVLGCYTGGNIYIYNIESKELDGIRELTTAHELLHANWARMSDDEKVALVEPLTRTWDANQSILESEINNYDTSQKQEELYVRAGTEVANLPDALEKHYAEIFKDQDKIVAYYNAYIGVFKALQAEMEGLKAEMEAIDAEVTAKIADYEKRVEQLDVNITSFNNCARTRGCFGTEIEFEVQRNALVAEQEALSALYEEINGLISSYNEKVEVYNADVLQNEKLNTMINSAAKPKEIE